MFTVRISLICSLLIAAAVTTPACAQQAKANKEAGGFRWVNPLKATDIPGLRHAMFRSPSMDVDVGYCIYLPEEYHWKGTERKRYPVVYYLHGGRPGNETKSVNLVKHVHQAIANDVIGPTIYVFVNGGPVSHYNMPERENAMGEDVFVKELIPHVDATYRTIAERGGRALEGFSQGGRGTARIIFRHPQLFCSAAPGGGGHATEKRISENDGYENESLRFAQGYNTWDLAAKFAEHSEPMPRILVFVGDQDFNHEGNVAYMAHLKSLGIPYEGLVVPGVPHSAEKIYQEEGPHIMRFHAESFRLAAEQR